MSAMNIDDLGEFNIIDRIANQLGAGVSGDETGIGDDCSVVTLNEDFYQITTTDLLMEDVHFTRDKISPRDLGFKSMAVNVSDIAAMGGLPKHVFLSLGLPKGLETSYLDQLIEGLKIACGCHGAKVMGGDTNAIPGKNHYKRADPRHC